MSRYLWVLAWGCTDPAGTDRGAIEITGYLDATGVVVTSVDGTARAMGRPGAASVGSGVVLENPAADTSSSGEVGADGAFALSVGADPGDTVVVRVDDADADDAVKVTLPIAPEPFPTWLHADAWANALDPHRVDVEVRLDPPRTDGVVWAADVATGAVAVLDVHEAGVTHAGALAGSEGDEVVVTFVTDRPSEGLALTVAPPP